MRTAVESLSKVDGVGSEKFVGFRQLCHFPNKSH